MLRTSQAKLERSDLGDTLPDRLRRQIGEWILGGTLPSGRRLDERGLAEQFGVSRTPVREALRQLHSAGLVEIVANRGAVVATVDVDKLVELFEVVAVLEAACARLAAVRMTPVERGRLEEIHVAEVAAVRRRNREAFATANRQFHTAIVAGAHNGSLEEVTNAYRVRTAPFRKAQLTLPGRLAAMATDDARILTLIASHDADGAATAIKEHLESTAFHAAKCLEGAATHASKTRRSKR